MRKLMTVAALLVSLAGCATRGQYGNFAAAPTIHNAQMAEDAVIQLKAFYPPAGTRLKLQQPASDPFGTALIGKLRQEGYAVMEATPRSNPWQGRADPTPGTDLRYVVDRLGGAEYLVVIRVGEGIISRSYRTDNNGLAAAGYWTRRE